MENNKIRHACTVCGRLSEVICIRTGRCVTCLSKAQVKTERRLALMHEKFEEIMKKHGDKPISCMNDGCGKTLTMREAHESGWYWSRGLILCYDCAKSGNIYVRVI